MIGLILCGIWFLVVLAHAIGIETPMTAGMILNRRKLTAAELERLMREVAYNYPILPMEELMPERYQIVDSPVTIIRRPL